MSSASQAEIQPLDPQAVRLALVMKGWTQARLAKEVGKSLAAVNLAINHNSYPAVTEKIRTLLGLP